MPSDLQGTKNLVTSGRGNIADSNYVAAAATPTGNLLIAYIPPHHKRCITVDMSAMRG